MNVSEVIDHVRRTSEDAVFLLRSVEYRAQSIVLHVDAYVEPAHEVVAWSIFCTDVEESSLSFDRNVDIELSEESEKHSGPLLWQYNEPGAELFFSARPAEPEKLLNELHRIHLNLFGRHRKPNLPSVDHIAKGHGLFCRGPAPLVERFEPILASAGGAPTMLRGAPARMNCVSSILAQPTLWQRDALWSEKILVPRWRCTGGITGKQRCQFWPLRTWRHASSSRTRPRRRRVDVHREE
jgi:hypothetical protein